MAAPSNSLYVLGRRIERLLLVGILILGACLLELYLARVTAAFADDRTIAALQQLMQALARNESQLSDLFARQAESAADRERRTSRENQIAETRRLLELPAPAPKIAEGSYSAKLRELATAAAESADVELDSIVRLVDPSKAPREVAAAIRSDVERATQRLVDVWGIQMARSVRVEYLGLDYRIPSAVLATTFAFALSLLAVGWLGSVYVTRQRELWIISELDDYKVAFPHILNFLPVVFGKLTAKLGVHQKPWERRLDEWVTRVIRPTLLASFRLLVLLLYAGPMIYALSASAYALWTASGERFSFRFGVLALLVLLMSFEALALLLQEWLVLHRKNFYD